MAERSSAGEGSPSPARSIVGLVVANTSLIAAILFYMGWAYDNALYGRFHLNPLDLGFGPQEYVLRSLSLFSPGIVVIAVLLIVVMSLGTGGKLAAVRAFGVDAGAAYAVLLRARRAVAAAPAEGGGGNGSPAAVAAQAPAGMAAPAADVSETAEPGKTEAGKTEDAMLPSAAASALAVGGGAALTAAGLVLYWIASRVNVSTFLVLALLGGGPLLLTWPARASRPGRVPYALALVIAAICALWAASVYAQQKGSEAAQAVIRNLPTSGSVVIYSTQRLALSGGGVSVTPITTSAPYRYEYAGLRLLLMQSGTYYLLPESWTPERDYTYVVYASDDMRIVFY
jgi:hypothetical protein